jgi:hypothetical protein
MQEPTDLQQLETGLEEAKKVIAFRDQILKLTENREFKRVVREEYFEKECARYARESADPALSDRQRADALAMAQAAGHFKRWLNFQIQMGNSAAEQLPEIESTIEQLRAEEGEANAE